MNTWIAVYTPNQITAIDIDTQKILWNINFTVDIILDYQFQAVDDELVAVSTDQIILLNRAGEKKVINLQSHGYDFDIIQLAAVYPNYLYIIRNSMRFIEAYDISKNEMVWSLPNGRTKWKKCRDIFRHI